MRRIVVTGPESSGKTTLALHLAHALGVPVVREQAREYLHHTDGKYTEADLLHIAHAQIAAEEALAKDAPDLLICDTDLLTIRIWSEEKYGRCDPWVKEQIRLRTYHHWLLCTPEMPWEADPLREHPHDRDRLFARHVTLLHELNKPFTELRGDPQQRLEQALDLLMRT